MSSDYQPSPVILYQPPANASERQFMDFRPMPIEEESDADPKGLSVPESAPSLPSVKTPSVPSPQVPPVKNAPAEKGSTQPKENGNSTPTS